MNTMAFDSPMPIKHPHRSTIIAFFDLMLRILESVSLPMAPSRSATVSGKMEIPPKVPLIKGYLSEFLKVF